MSNLAARFSRREAVVGVIGLGYVGLPLSLVFAEAGFAVHGYDTDPEKIQALQSGRSYIRTIGPERVAAMVTAEKFRPQGSFDTLGECDAVLIAVPTPLGQHREPDLTYVRRTAAEVGRRLRPGQLVVLESTTYPGTTEEEVQPRLEAQGLRTPRDFFLAYSPEREDPGNRRFTTRNIPKLVGGVNPPSTEVACALYGAAIEKVVPVSSARVAEAAKLLENIYRCINIALVNELKMTFDRMGINIWEVIEAASTKPFGFTPFYPGPGLGGHCIPLDPFYLSWKAAQYGMWTRFIELAGEINTGMPRYVVNKVVEALNDEGKSVKGARVLILGLAYKPDIDDDRESPSYELIRLLEERGAQVAYCDPFFPETRRGRRHDLKLRSVPVDADAFGRFDALVVATAHTAFKQPELYRRVSLVIDTRNLLPWERTGGPGRVVRA